MWSLRGCGGLVEGSAEHREKRRRSTLDRVRRVDLSDGALVRRRCGRRGGAGFRSRSASGRLDGTPQRRRLPSRRGGPTRSGGRVGASGLLPRPRPGARGRIGGSHQTRAGDDPCPLGDPDTAEEVLESTLRLPDTDPRDAWRIALYRALAAQRRGSPEAGRFAASAFDAAAALGDPALPLLREGDVARQGPRSRDRKRVCSRGFALGGTATYLGQDVGRLRDHAAAVERSPCETGERPRR